MYTEKNYVRAMKRVLKACDRIDVLPPDQKKIRWDYIKKLLRVAVGAAEFAADDAGATEVVVESLNNATAVALGCKSDSDFRRRMAEKGIVLEEKDVEQLALPME